LNYRRNEISIGGCSLNFGLIFVKTPRYETSLVQATGSFGAAAQLLESTTCFHRSIFTFAIDSDLIPSIFLISFVSLHRVYFKMIYLNSICFSKSLAIQQLAALSNPYHGDYCWEIVRVFVERFLLFSFIECSA
jgi:hypothetical protein